jgi:predicted transcriptional regulator
VGALETAVLECLWASPDALTPREVLGHLDAGLAYTTVVTILTRLADKGLVERALDGRVYRYRPVLSEAELLAGRMRDVLSASGDSRATLSQFVAGLSRKDARALRALLDDVGERRR